MIGHQHAGAAGLCDDAEAVACGNAQYAKPSTMSSMCSSLRARIMPCWRITPSNTASAPASDPVCDAAARAPAALLPRPW